ncbi:MAG: helix-hairpin-helix domain-containing protein [Verrucomicrobiota bacterium]
MAPRKSKNSPGIPGQVSRLEDLPNIGRKLAADLRRIGIAQPQDLVGRDPLAMFHELAPVMGHRHDPCVFYTLLAVRHFLQHSEALGWWKFTLEGKEILRR